MAALRSHRLDREAVALFGGGLTLSFFEELDFDDDPATEPHAPEPKKGRRRPSMPRRGGGGSGGGEGGGRHVQYQRLLPVVIAVVLVVVLGIFLLQRCQSDAQQSAYHSYVDNVNAVVTTSNAVGSDLQKTLFNPAGTATSVEASLAQLVKRAQQVESSTTKFSDTGRLKGLQVNLLRTMRYRTNGLESLRAALVLALAKNGDTIQNRQAVADAYQRLMASDVIYADEFHTPGQDGLTAAGIHDAQIDGSAVAQDANLGVWSSDHLLGMLTRLRGSSGTGGGTQACTNPGTALAGVVVQPGDVKLVPDTPVQVKSSSSSYTFHVSVTNSGDCQLVNVQVHLIQAGHPMQPSTIGVLDQGQTSEVTFPGYGATFSGGPQKIQVRVVPVPKETNAGNNAYTYLISWQP